MPKERQAYRKGSTLATAEKERKRVVNSLGGGVLKTVKKAIPKPSY